MLGFIMPAPLAMPATVTVFPPRRSCRTAALGKASVVMMPATAFQNPRGDRAVTAWRMPACIFFHLGSTPMTPVEDDSTSRESIPSSDPANSHVSRASVRPGLAVEAFALPLFTTTACKRPALTCSRPTMTGAAVTLLVVNAATAVAGTSETNSDRSFLPLGLRPQATPAKRNPGTMTGDFATLIFMSFFVEMRPRTLRPVALLVLLAAAARARGIAADLGRVAYDLDRACRLCRRALPDARGGHGRGIRFRLR